LKFFMRYNSTDHLSYFFLLLCFQIVFVKNIDQSDTPDY
jgi:hypothetical protein